MSPALAGGWQPAKCSNKCSSLSVSATPPSNRCPQKFSFARMLSKKSPARRLPPGCDRERICALHGRLGGCIGERSQRRQIHLLRVRAAPIQDPAFDRNRSTEALLNRIGGSVWSPAFRRPPKGGTPNLPPLRWGTLFVVARSTLAAASATMRLELRFQLIELRLLLSGQHRKHLLMERKSGPHHLRLQACHFRQFLSSQRFVERTAFT